MFFLGHFSVLSSKQATVATEDEVKVNFVGGELYIKYDRVENIVYLKGTATTVYTGEVDI